MNDLPSISTLVRDIRIIISYVECYIRVNDCSIRVSGCQWVNLAVNGLIN